MDIQGNSGNSILSPSRAHFDDAVRFWEAWRIPYNAVLFGLVVETVGWSLLAKPATVLIFVVLASVANLLFCLAYPLDLVMQWSGLSPEWRRWGRYAVLTAGTLVAGAITVLICSTGLF